MFWIGSGAVKPLFGWTCFPVVSFTVHSHDAVFEPVELGENRLSPLADYAFKWPASLSVYANLIVCSLYSRF